MSHALPDPVQSHLHELVVGIEDRLQADSHLVSRVTESNKAWDVGWIEGGLIRAVIADSARPLVGRQFELVNLGNGGIEVINVHGGIERRFRFRKARRDALGRLVVTSNTDSIMTRIARDPNLFDDASNLPDVDHVEQWVIAYRVHPITRTFYEVNAGLVDGFLNRRPPYRLKLINVAAIPHIASLPPDFKPKNDDLDLPGEDEGRDEQAG